MRPTHPRPKFTRISPAVVCAATTLLFAAAPQASAAIHRLNTTEMSLFKKISRDSGQERRVMKLDPILCKVARQRARDMARNSYFNHTDLSGRGPNWWVKRAGYALPGSYDSSRGGNNIESIALAGSDTAEVVRLWKGSPPHRVHVLGELSFYQGQESIGVGTFTTSGTPSRTYYVFLSAPENQAIYPPRITLKNSAGRLISNTR